MLNREIYIRFENTFYADEFSEIFLFVKYIYTTKCLYNIIYLYLIYVKLLYLWKWIPNQLYSQFTLDGIVYSSIKYIYEIIKITYNSKIRV